MVQREIPGDPKNPRPLAWPIRVRHRASHDAKEHFLRQVCRLTAADDPAQIAEDAFAMLGK